MIAGRKQPAARQAGDQTHAPVAHHPAVSSAAWLMMAAPLMTFAGVIRAGLIDRQSFSPSAVTITYRDQNSDQVSPMTVAGHLHQILATPAPTQKFKFPGIDLDDLARPDFYVLGAGAVFEIRLAGGPYRRVGLDVGHPLSSRQTIAFYDDQDQLLVSHTFTVTAGSVFVGYQAPAGSGIARLLITDDPQDNHSAYYDNLTVDGPLTVEPVPGDFNTDGQVEQADLNLLLACWGAVSVGPDWTADFDGQVDQNELNDLLGRWGWGVGAAYPAGPTQVPAPASLVVLWTCWSAVRPGRGNRPQ